MVARRVVQMTGLSEVIDRVEHQHERVVIIDRVEHQHERVVITRNGRAAAVLISPEDLEALEETLSVLHDPEALSDIREADAACARGDVVRGVDAVRRLRQ